MTKKMIIIPTVSIYFDELNEQYLVQPCVPSSLGASEEFGDPFPVSEQDFDASITEIVLDSLDGYLKTKYDPARKRRRSNEQQLDFVSQHKLVSVSKLPDGHIEVSACERQGGGYHGVDDGDVVLEAASAQEDMPRAIREAFRKTR